MSDEAKVLNEVRAPLADERQEFHGWRRLLVAALMLIVLGIVSASCWVVGILMFTFALDGANSSQLPWWLDTFMLIVWPVTVAIVAVIPPMLYAIGQPASIAIRSLFGAVVLSGLTFGVGVLALFSSL